MYCGETVGWIKVKLGMQVRLAPGHIVLDGDQAAPPPKGHPNFWLISVVTKWLDGSSHLVVAVRYSGTIVGRINEFASGVKKFHSL